MIAVAGATGYIGGLLCSAACARTGRRCGRWPGIAGARRDLPRLGCEVRAGRRPRPDDACGRRWRGSTSPTTSSTRWAAAPTSDFAARDSTRARRTSPPPRPRPGCGGSSTWAASARAPSTWRSRHATAETLRAGERPGRLLPRRRRDRRRQRVVPHRLLPGPAPAADGDADAGSRPATQPIAVDDVVAYLAAAADLDAPLDRELQIGGPDVTTYGGMIDELARRWAGGPRCGSPSRSSPRASPRSGSVW